MTGIIWQETIAMMNKIRIPLVALIIKWWYFDISLIQER
jgi:hypothetical protein